MNALLTRNVRVRTPSGLVPFEALAEGCSVISFDGDNICTDVIVSISAETVSESATEIGTDHDDALLYMVSPVAIGDAIDEIGDDMVSIKPSSIRSMHRTKYDDIVFKVVTKNHNRIFVGDDGKILISVG